jgi:hypothetical protein
VAVLKMRNITTKEKVYIPIYFPTNESKSIPKIKDIIPPEAILNLSKEINRTRGKIEFGTIIGKGTRKVRVPCKTSNIKPKTIKRKGNIEFYFF